MRKKLFVFFMLILFFGVFLTGFLSYGLTKEIISKNTINNLRSESNMIKDYIINTDESVNFDLLAKKIKNITGKRITIIDEGGIVVGESELISKNMENHIKRPEVIDAFNYGEGFSIRMSSTKKISMCYFASSLIKNGKRYVVRLSVEFDAIKIMQSRYLTLFILPITVGIIISAILMYFYIDIFTHPIRMLTRIATTIALGQYDMRINESSKDEIGQLGHAFNMMADRLQETIEDLSNKKNNLSSILSSMDDGVIVVDNNERILMINAAARDFFNIKGEAAGKCINELIKNHNLSDIVKNIPDEDVEISINNPQRLLKIKTTKVVNEDKNSSTIGTMMFIQDITRIRAFDKMRADFAANVSHELKSPLTSIKGFAETLKYVDDEPTRKKFLDIINVEAERLSRLINDILTLSELENKDFSVNFEKIDIKDSIEDVIYLMEPAIREKNITIEKEFLNDNLFIYGDRDKFKQMIINLFDNGIKYTNPGGKINISVCIEEEYINLLIEDNGIGIPNEDIPRIFERFYRVDKGRSRKMGGTGLGLAIVKHIVMILNGDISVKSDIGKGTKFIIKLPLAK